MAQLKNLVDRGSFVREVTDFPAGIVDDGVQGFAIEGKKFVRTKRGRKFKSEEIGIWANGADMTAKLQSRINHADVRIIELDADGGDILINGTVTIPEGKSLRINNGTRLTGTGTLVNAKIDAGLYPIFATTITLTNCDSLIGFFPPEWFGAIGNGSNDDTASIQACCNAAIRNTGGLVKLMPNKNYKITSVIIESFREGQMPIFTIDGCNAKITVDGANVGFVKNVTTQSSADVEVNSRMEFKNIRFVGSGVAGCGAVRIAPTYGTQFNLCNFINFDTAVELRFCLNALLIHCKFQNSISYDVIMADGDWTGASGNNSQTNQTKMINCRHFCKSGQLAAVRILKTSGVVLDDCIYEGGNPVRNIEFNSTGSTTVQHFNIIRPHVENAPTSESILLETSALVLIDQYWSQLGHTITRTQGTTFPKIIVRNMKYFNGDNLKFAFGNNGGANGVGAIWIEGMDFEQVGDATTFWTRKIIVDASHSLPFYRYYSTNANGFNSLAVNESLSTKRLVVSGDIAQFNNNVYNKALTYLEGDTYLSSTKALFIGNTAGVSAQHIQGTSTYAQWYAGMRYVMRMHNDGKLTIGWGGTAAVDIDMSGARDAMLPPKLAADPSTPVEGMFYHNTATKRLKHHNGSGWRDLADTDSAQTLTNKTLGSGTKVNLGTVAPGDMYYGDASGNLVRVPKGAVGQVWSVISDTVLGWKNDASGGAAPSGSGVDAIRTVTSNTTFTSADHTLLVDTSAGPVAIAVDVLSAGKDGWIKKISDDTNAVTITPVSGTIDGGPNYVLDGYNEPVIMKSNGTNLYIFNK